MKITNAFDSLIKEFNFLDSTIDKSRTANSLILPNYIHTANREALSLIAHHSGESKYDVIARAMLEVRFAELEEITAPLEKPYDPRFNNPLAVGASQ